MAEPDYAVVEILCGESEWDGLQSIPDLLTQVGPLVTDGPGIVRIFALADAAAQAAVIALGCSLTVVVSVEDYQDQIDTAYATLGEPSTQPDGIV